MCVGLRPISVHPSQVRNKVLESRGAIWSLVMRGVEIVWNLGFYWSTLMYDCLVGRDEEVVPFRAKQLRNLLCDLGPSFIKAGQVWFFPFPPSPPLRHLLMERISYFFRMSVNTRAESMPLFDRFSLTGLISSGRTT